MVGRRDVGEVRVNPYGLKIDFNAIERLESVLETIEKSQPSDINAWRVSKGTTVEDHIRAIFEEAKRAHDCNQEASSRVAADMISRTLLKFEKVIWIKLNYDEATPARVANINHDINFEQLTAFLASMHSKAVDACFKDPLGELIQLDGDLSLANAIAQHKHNNSYALAPVRHCRYIASKARLTIYLLLRNFTGPTWSCGLRPSREAMLPAQPAAPAPARARARARVVPC